MSEEEKKAIENLKEVVDLYNDECLITTDYDFKSIEIILNLIEKQKKEIEELKMKLWKKELIIDGMKEDRRIAVEEIQEQYYVSKDKIREKIEEYNKMINATYKDLTHYADYRRDVCFEIKNVLNELLEDKK